MTLKYQCPNVNTKAVVGGFFTPEWYRYFRADFEASGSGQGPLLSSALASSHIFVGNAGGVAQDVALSGDGSITNAGALSVTGTHLSSALPVNQGGTGQTTLTVHGVLIGEGTNGIVATTAGASGALLLGQGAADPSFNAMSGDATITNAGAITVTATHLSSALPVNQGGTGVATLTAHAVLVGEGTGSVVGVGPGSAGTVLTGAGAGSDPVFKSGASSQSTLSNQSTSSTTGVMLGYGGTIALTPNFSGKILVIFNGVITNNTALDGAEVNIHYGTGSAPAAGDAATGISVGATTGIVNNAATAGLLVPISISALITGLTVGTAYWFDLDMFSVTAGTSTFANAYGLATELP